MARGASAFRRFGARGIVRAGNAFPIFDDELQGTLIDLVSLSPCWAVTAKRPSHRIRYSARNMFRLPQPMRAASKAFRWPREAA